MISSTFSEKIALNLLKPSESINVLNCSQPRIDLLVTSVELSVASTGSA